MKVKALKSMAGNPRCVAGEVLEVDAKTGKSLIKLGYAAAVPTKAKKTGPKPEKSA